MILELETGLGAKISHDEEAISDFRSGAFASIHSVPGTCTATVCPALGAVPHKQCPMHGKCMHTSRSESLIANAVFDRSRIHFTQNLYHWTQQRGPISSIPGRFWHLVQQCEPPQFPILVADRIMERVRSDISPESVQSDSRTGCSCTSHFEEPRSDSQASISCHNLH
jgi:hypothetical protein